MKQMKWFVLFVVGVCVLIGVTIPKSLHAAENSPGYDTPLAKYGDLEFSLGYFFYYTRVSNDKLRMMNRAEGKDREDLINKALDETIFEHLIVKDAEKNGYMKEPEYLVHVRDMECDWLTRLYEYHNFYKNYKPDEEQLNKMYEERKKDYFQQEEFSFRHIFFRTVDLPENEQKQAREKAEKALALIKGGSDFVEVAKEYSDSDRKGTVIGPMTPSKYKPEKPLNPTLEEALLAMKPGDVSGIVDTKYGYEILKLETFRPESYQPLESVKNKLSNELRSQDFEKWKKDFLAANWEKAVTKFNPDVIFKENADPNEVVFDVFGMVFNASDYKWIKGRGDQKKPEETDAQFHDRQVDFLKNTLAYRYLVAHFAREQKIDQIPYYLERTKLLRNYQTYLAWWNKTIQKFIDEHPNTEEEKAQFYTENQSRFLKPQKAHIGEMTFNLPSHDKDVLYEVHKAQLAAEEKAKKAIERVKNGEAFAQVAREMSESETAKNGGDLGVIGADTTSIPQAVASQAIRLATGEVCKEPIKNGDIYYVVYCYDKPEREKIPASDPEVQTAIDRGVTGKKRNDFMQQKTTELVDHSKVELLFKDLNTFNPTNLTFPSLELPSAEKEASAPVDKPSTEK